MSSPDVACAAPVWKPRRLKVPRRDRSLLVEPSLEEAIPAARANHELLETDRIQLQGRPLSVLRRWSRDACFQLARDYTQSLAGSAIDPVDPDNAPVFVAGHQPSLYHPGVWVKNFAIDRLASQTGGVSLNLIVDNDTLGSTSLQVPVGSRDEPRVMSIAFAATRAIQPWEDAHVVDTQTFDSFAERVSNRMDAWGISPLLTDIWPDAVAHRTSSSRLCDCLSAARHRQERRWGLANLELPISHMCQSEPFLWFASHILAQLSRFRETHNQVLETYRQLNGVRSRNHPVPHLAENDGWQEAPFWFWREGDSRRRGVLARQSGREVLLSDGEETFARLPLAPDMDACCAVEVLKELPARGLRFRTRALTTTLFSRLCLGDLFVHGIGGAKYDEMTDQIIREFYGLEPPRFLTMSATVHLPLGEPFPTTQDDRRRIERLLRDLSFNAERHGLGPEADELIAEKEQLIAEQKSAKTEGLTRSQRRRRTPANLERHRRLKQVSARLGELAGDQQAAAERELSQIRRELDANSVLQRRDFSFALYPSEMLREFLTGI